MKLCTARLSFVLLPMAVTWALPLGAADVATSPATTKPAADKVQEIRERLTKKYGQDLLYETDESLKILFATNTDRATLGTIRDQLTAHARALHRDLFDKGLQQYLTIAIPKEWKGSARGWYNPEDNSILAKGPGPELVHEFTHALHFADQKGRNQMMHQNWIIEGLACLFESSEIVDGHAVPRHNHRLKIIQDVVRRKEQSPFATFVTFDQKQFMKRPGYHYSQACYMLRYLHDKGLLKQWYDAYTANFAQDRTGGQAMDKVLGKPLPTIEKDWCEWVLAIPPQAPKTAPVTKETK